MKSVQFTQEASLSEYLPKKITVFWQEGLFESFSGVDGVNIQYAIFSHKENDAPCLVIVPGRSEGYLKYQELAFDLYAQGYNIFIIDHRGQGISERLLADPHKGYVKHFQDYVDDLAFFVENIVAKFCSTKPFILAHSMGGAIAARFMQDSPSAIKAAVISSPMIGFDSGLFPKALAELLIKTKLKVNKFNSNTPWYFLGQKGYTSTPFSQNKLSHSTKRYKIFNDLYQQNKKIQLGGVTSHWLAQSLLAQQEIMAKLNQLETPILLLQAGSDSVVCPQAQNDFCQKLHALKPQSCPNGSAIRIENAFHELFFELDSYRNSALEQTLSWFKEHK